MALSGSPLLTGLLIAWGVVTTILVLLMIYRGMVSMHQEDQIVLSAASQTFENESQAADARIARLRPYVMGTAWLSGLLAVVIVASWATDMVRHF